MTPKERAADLRLQRTYGITLVEYNQQLRKQKGVCAICGRPPKRLRLAVDHNHKIERTKIVTFLLPEGWVAGAFVTVDGKSGVEVSGSGTTKAEAINAVRLKLKRRSVRGLLCMICNRKVLGIMERFRIVPARVIDYLCKYDPSNALVNPIKE